MIIIELSEITDRFLSYTTEHADKILHWKRVEKMIATAFYIKSHFKAVKLLFQT